MGFKKNDKVLVITKKGDDYSSETDEVSSVSGGQISLSKKSGKFKSSGKHQSDSLRVIVPLEDYSQSAFVRSGTTKSIKLDKEKAKKLFEGAK